MIKLTKLLIFSFALLLHVDSNIALCQQLNFKLADTLNLNIGSETSSFQITTFASDSILYYFDQNEPQKNGGKYLTLHSVNSNSKQRTEIRLEDAGNDINIFSTCFLVVSKDYIIINFRDTNIVFFDKKGKYLKRLTKEKGYLNYAYLERLNRLVLIDYYGYSILSRKPLLYLATIDLSDLKIEYKKEYFYQSIQYNFYNSKLNDADKEHFYIAEPLSNRIYKYDYTLSRIDSLSVRPFCDSSIALNEKLSQRTRQTIEHNDSLINAKVDSAGIRKFFFDDEAQYFTTFRKTSEQQDRFIDRIRNINVFNDRMYVSKKMKGHHFMDNLLDVDIVDLNSKKVLYSDIRYDGNTKNAQTKDDYFKYCLNCSLSMQTVSFNGKHYAYSLSNNNFMPVEMRSRDDYNGQFDKWMLTNTPHYIIKLYEIQE